MIATRSRAFHSEKIRKLAILPCVKDRELSKDIEVLRQDQNQRALCLGCKRSWVQIPPVRPPKSLEITKEIQEKRLVIHSGNSAHFYSNLAHFRPLIRKPFGESAASKENIKGNQRRSGGRMHTIELTIIAWDKHQPRKDIKHPTWFALSNSVLEDPKLFSFSADEFKAWIYILCQASKENSGDVKVYPAHADRVCRISEKTLNATFEKLSEAEIIQIVSDSRTESVRVRTQSVRVRTQSVRDRQTDTTDRQTDTLDFSDLWNSNCGELPKLRKLTDSRKAKLNRQLETYPDPAHWLEVLEKWKASAFCLTEWKPTFDDWLREDIRIKTLEGKYDNRKSTAATKEDWTAMAQKVLTAVRRFGSRNPDEAKAFLGDELYGRVRAAGGLSLIGQMPANDFTLTKLAAMLKAAEIPAVDKGA